MSDEGARRVGNTGLRRRISTVDRLLPPHRPAWSDTGDFEMPREDLLRTTGSLEAALPSGEEEVAPLVTAHARRPRTPAEQRLRLVAAPLLLATVLAFFAQAAAFTAVRLATGLPSDVWRAVSITVDSAPVGATVYINNAPAGTTPLRTVVRCGGRVLHLRLEHADHDTWESSRLCHLDRDLVVDARLRPVSTR